MATYITIVRKDMDVNQHERLSNITLRHKLKQLNNAFIAVLQIATHNFEHMTYLLPILCRI